MLSDLNIVAIGGGTGLATMLRGLKEYSKNITAIVTVSDDGGGSGIIRDDLGILPPGDIRNCILALSNAEPIMNELLSYRFQNGVNKDQCFGNLFLAALNGISHGFEEAVLKMSNVLAITGRVVPVTTSSIDLKAVFEDGSVIVGESSIFKHKKECKCRIRNIELVPRGAAAVSSAADAILCADVIVLGPGSLYTSIIPNLLVDGICENISKSHAVKIYVSNIMTQEGETEGYSCGDHINAIFKHSQDNIFDICLYNNQHIEEKFLEKYSLEGSEPVKIDTQNFGNENIIFYGYPIIRDNYDLARHDPIKLACAIIDIVRREK